MWSNFFYRYIISIPTLYELFIKDFQIMHYYTIFDTPYLYTSIFVPSTHAWARVLCLSVDFPCEAG